MNKFHFESFSYNFIHLFQWNVYVRVVAFSLSLFPLLCLSCGSRRSHFLISIRLKHSTLVSTIRRKPRWNIHHVEIVFMVALTILHWTCAGKLIFLTSFHSATVCCFFLSNLQALVLYAATGIKERKRKLTTLLHLVIKNRK